MIGGIGRTGSAQARGQDRTDKRVTAGTGAATAEDRRDETGRMPVPVGEPAARSSGFGRPRHSAAFVAQLAALHLGAAAEGDRRVRRAPEAVAPRATGSYRAAGALATRIEPGFLVRREI